jgi:HPt (histidine-containing phosphotransfer) domain-containing protein
MDMPGMDSVPAECRGVDFDKAALRLPAKMGALFLAAGEQRLRELDQAMAAGDAGAVMDAAHSLASLTGLLPVQSLALYAREIYAAGEQDDLSAAGRAHERLSLVMGWIFGKLRSLGHEANAS